MNFSLSRDGFQLLLILFLKVFYISVVTATRNRTRDPVEYRSLNFAALL